MTTWVKASINTNRSVSLENDITLMQPLKPGKNTFNSTSRNNNIQYLRQYIYIVSYLDSNIIILHCPVHEVDKN